jgi:predicted HAD superfamily Cof-like phosphohydrolase
MVQQFHEANGAVINGINNGPEVAVLRTRLILEELAETYAALHENDVIEAADGLADLLYVIYGAAVSYGVPCSDIDEEPLGAPTLTFNRQEILRFGRMALPRLQRVVNALAIVPGDCGPALEDLAEMVWAYAARTWGFPVRELFEEVHRSNMTKTFAKNTTGGKYGAVKPKGPSYSAPDIAGVLKTASEKALQRA